MLKSCLKIGTCQCKVVWTWPYLQGRSTTQSGRGYSGSPLDWLAWCRHTNHLLWIRVEFNVATGNVTCPLLNKRVSFDSYHSISPLSHLAAFRCRKRCPCRFYRIYKARRIDATDGNHSESGILHLCLHQRVSPQHIGRLVVS